MVLEHTFKRVTEIRPATVHFAQPIGPVVHIGSQQKCSSDQDVDPSKAENSQKIIDVKLYIVVVVGVGSGDSEVDEERIGLQYQYQPLNQYVQNLLTCYYRCLLI